MTSFQAAPSHSHVSPKKPPGPSPPKSTVRLRAGSYTSGASSRGAGLGPDGVTSNQALACASNSQVEPSQTYGALPPPNITTRCGLGERAM